MQKLTGNRGSTKSDLCLEKALPLLTMTMPSDSKEYYAEAYNNRGAVPGSWAWTIMKRLVADFDQGNPTMAGFSLRIQQSR